MKYIIDRIEEDMLVLEDEHLKKYNIPKDLICDAKEGDLVTITIEKKQNDKVSELFRRLIKD